MFMKSTCNLSRKFAATNAHRLNFLRVQSKFFASINFFDKSSI